MALVLLDGLKLVMGTARFLRDRRRPIEGDSTPAAADLVIVAGGMELAGAFVVYAALRALP